MSAALREDADTVPLKALFWQMIEWNRLSAEVINRLMDGKDNATGLFTVALSVATTTLIDRRIGPDTLVVMVPTTAVAATEVATLYQDLPNITRGQAVLNHTNSATAARTFGYALRG